MKLEHTPGLTFALRRAMRYAEHEGLAEIAPLHLLRGLLAEEEGRCVALLAEAGVDLVAWQTRFSEAREIAPVADDQQLRLTRPARNILTLAREEISAIAEEGSLATDQVLLALLEEAG
jgi:ATP-dependent Clp protease ATP-binding subunit ClpA